MNKKDFTISFNVEQPARDVFNAVCNVSKWWTENVTGNSHEFNDEFTVQFGDRHFSKQKLVETVPHKKITWLVTESRLSWLRNQQEWTGTKIDFEIADLGDRTQLHFTHVGLVPGIECYHDCSNGWSQYIGSLYDLITTGKGEPDKKQGKKSPVR